MAPVYVLEFSEPVQLAAQPQQLGHVAPWRHRVSRHGSGNGARVDRVFFFEGAAELGAKLLEFENRGLTTRDVLA